MFAAWDYSFECPWVWDALLEAVANNTQRPDGCVVDSIVPILSQCEPWGGRMHDEMVRPCFSSTHHLFGFCLCPVYLSETGKVSNRAGKCLGASIGSDMNAD